MDLVPAGIRDADLETMTDGALATLEDQLLLEGELDLSRGAQLTAARVVVWVLMLLGIVIALALLSRLPTRNLGPLNIPLYLLAIGLGASGAHLLWSGAGRQLRTVVRTALDYWPLLLYLGATFYGLMRR